MASLDKTTMKTVVLPFEHQLVHKGMMNMISMYNTCAAAATVEFGIKTANETHAVISVITSGQALLKVYENPTNSAFGAGSTITCVNMNRHAGTTLSLTGCKTPTWKTATTKTPIFTDLIPGGEKNVSMVGGGTRLNTELVLSASSFYIFQVTNQAGGTIGACFNMQFYELSV